MYKQQTCDPAKRLITWVLSYCEEFLKKVKLKGEYLFKSRAILGIFKNWFHQGVIILREPVSLQFLYRHGTLDLYLEAGFSGREILKDYFLPHTKDHVSLSCIKSIFKYQTVDQLQVLEMNPLCVHMVEFGSSIHRFLYYQVCPRRNRRYAVLFARAASSDSVVFNGEPMPFLPAEIWELILDYATSV